MTNCNSDMKLLLVRVITLYQRSFSPDHGICSYRHPYGFCRYYPSCSEYARQSIGKHGVVRGLWLSFLRVLRCNPFSRGGYDPV